MKLFNIGIIALGIATIQARAEVAEIDANQLLGEFYSQMGGLKTAEGDGVAQLFASDTLQHFSGSKGNRVRLSCEDASTPIPEGLQGHCDVVVTIFYGRHGEENGITQEARYELKFQTYQQTVNFSSVKRTLSPAS